MDVCIHDVSLYSFSGEICYGCVYSLRVSLFIPCISSRDICYGCVYFILQRHIIKMCVLCIHCMCLYSLYGMDTHIHSLETYVMNVCIHVLWLCVCIACVSIHYMDWIHTFVHKRHMLWMCVSIMCVSVHSLERSVMDVCIHCVCLYSLHVYSLVTYAMNVCISFSRDIFYECVYSLYI